MKNAKVAIKGRMSDQVPPGVEVNQKRVKNPILDWNKLTSDWLQEEHLEEALVDALHGYKILVEMDLIKQLIAIVIAHSPSLVKQNK